MLGGSSGLLRVSLAYAGQHEARTARSGRRIARGDRLQLRPKTLIRNRRGQSAIVFKFARAAAIDGIDQYGAQTTFVRFFRRGAPQAVRVRG